MEEGEIEVKQPAKKSAAPGFQGDLQMAFNQAPAVVEPPAAKVDSEISEDDLVPLPPPSASEPTAAKVDSEISEDDLVLLPPPSAPEPTSPPILPASAVTSRSSSSPITSTTPRTFNTTIDKGSRKLGIDINYHDNITLLVTKVNAGPVLDHNSKQSSEQILPGDRITELNGIRGNTQQMLASCGGATELQVTVTTGVERTTRINAGSAGQTLGITAEPCDTVSLVITKVEDGLLKLRTGSDPELDLTVDDRIVGINDVRLDAAELLRELSSATSWNIAWRRIVTNQV